MVLNESYPSDIRVLKEARVLIGAGYEITLCCVRRQGEKHSEVVDGIKVVRVSGSEQIWKKGLLDIFLAVFRIHPFFWMKLKSILRVEKFDLVHVHDLPLLFTAKALSPVPVILDMHENYPDALAVWFKWRKNPLIKLKNSMFFGYNRWHKFELDAARKADEIIAVVDEMKKRLIEQSGISEKKVAVISNMEDRHFLNQEVDPNIFDKFEGKFIVSYTGNVGPHRGVDTLVKAMSHLKDEQDIVALIIGTCSSDTEAYLRSLIAKHGITNNVELWGYRPFHQFYSFMNMSSVNIIPHNRSGHTDHTIPHKLFQAMMVGKPVIVSSCKPLKRTVESSNAGLVFEAENAEDLARQILALYQNPALCESFGRNGKTATIDGEMNWEREGEKLLSLYAKYCN